MDSPMVFVAVAAALAFTSLDGGLYEFLVVAPFGARRPDPIQPQRVGISRTRFWIPAHTTFELLLLGISAGRERQSSRSTNLFPTPSSEQS